MCNACQWQREALEFGSSEELASLTIERANEKSLREDDEPKVVSYLQAGHVLMASPGIVRDVLDSRGGIIGALAILTDGTYAWPSDLAHYVERYHARLPDQLIAHMASLGWRMPDHVDLSAVQLV